MDSTVRMRRSLVRYRRYGWVASLVLHAALTAGLFAWSFEPWWAAAGDARRARTIQVTMAQAPAADVAPEVRIVGDPAEVTAQMVRQRVEEEVDASAALSRADKLARLDALSQRLNQVADEGSIDALSGVMHSLLGTKPRAVEPAKVAPGGTFDFDTAQFHDILRLPKDGGGFRYVTVLLDAQGRTVQTEVSAQEGEPLYELMQRIKANPLLEQVYRQIVMPLMDQLVASAKQADAGKATLTIPAAAGDTPPR